MKYNGTEITRTCMNSRKKKFKDILFLFDKQKKWCWWWYNIKCLASDAMTTWILGLGNTEVFMTYSIFNVSIKVSFVSFSVRYNFFFYFWTLWIHIGSVALLVLWKFLFLTDYFMLVNWVFSSIFVWLIDKCISVLFWYFSDVFITRL